MKKSHRIFWSLVFLSIFMTGLAAAPIQVNQQEDQVPDVDITPNEDVITASEGTGGYLSTRDIILIVIIIFAVIGLAAVL